MKDFKFYFFVIFSATLSVLSAQIAFATQYDDPTCDSICSVLVDPTAKQTLNLAGTGAWGATDDAWCAANFSSGTTPAPSSDPNYQNEITRCQFHDGQMISYCDAYESVQQANSMETPILVLDIAGTAACTTACFASTTGGLIAPAYMACRAGSLAASSLELLDSFLMSGSAVGKAVTGFLGAAGIASNLYEMSDVGNIGKFLKGDDGSDDQKAKHNACVTASVLAVATGLRVYDITNQGNSEKSACANVKKLLSTDPVIGVAAPVASPGTGVASTGGSSLGLSGGNGTLYTPPSLLGNGKSNLSNQIACAQSGSTTCDFMNQGVSGATNGGLLATNGLGQALANTITPNSLAAMQQAIGSGADAGSLLSSALSGSGLSDDVATKVADIAKNSQADALALKGSDSAKAYTPSGAKTKTTSPTLGGFNFDTAATGAAKEQTFSRAPAAAGEEGDIWHADYKGSIFQIVSTKINATKDRVNTVDWSTPLNRALMGLPAHPREGSAQ